MNAPAISISCCSSVSLLRSRAISSPPLSPATNSSIVKRRQPLDVLDRARALEHDLRRAKLLAAVDDDDLGRELREEDRLLHRAVAATDDHRRLLLEERRVAGRAVRDAAAAELLLAAHLELLVLGAHREDHGAGAVLVLADPDLVDAAGLVGELDLRRLVGDEARAESLGLVAHLLHEGGALDALREARIVLDVGRLLQQPAPEEALDDERLEVGARRVEGRGEAGRSGADDDDVLDAVRAWAGHFTKYSGISGQALAAAGTSLRAARSSPQRDTVRRS